MIVINSLCIIYLLSPGGVGKLKKKSGKNKPGTGGNYNNNKNLINKNWNVGQYLMLVMVLSIFLLMFVGPFMRGLYFPRELIVANMLAFSLLAIWGFYRIRINDGSYFRSPTDLSVNVLLFAYLLSLFTAIQIREAVTEVTKVITYVIVYYVAFDIGRHFKFKFRGNIYANRPKESESAVLPVGVNLLLHFALVAAFIIAVASLGVAAGSWDFPFAYDGRRIGSPIGYANTAAAYLMAAYLLAISLAPIGRKLVRTLYLISASLMLITVILTLSRGAWLLLPPLALFLILITAPGERLRTTLNLAASTFIAIPFAMILDNVFQSDAPARSWLLIFVVIVLSVISSLIIEMFLKLKRKTRLALIGSLAGAVIIIMVIFIGRVVISPIKLVHSNAENGSDITKVEQMLSAVTPGEDYALTFEIKTDPLNSASSPFTEDVWELVILGGLPEYSYTELVRHSAGMNQDWQTETVHFTANTDITRMEVKLANRQPGTSVTIRSVELITGAKSKKLNFLAYRLLPERFYNRLYSFSRDINAGRRLEIYEDALKVIKDNPVFGLGGRGWAAVYKSYIDQPYNSRTVHNHYLEVWIEAGIFGFLSFAGLWVFFAWAFIRNCVQRKASPVIRNAWTALFIPVAALGAHSAIDWNFTFASVGIYLFVLLGAGMSLDNTGWFAKKGPNQSSSLKGFTVGVPAIISGVILAIYAVFLFLGLHATWQSQEYAARGNTKMAIAEMEKAIRYDPLRAENYHNLNLVMENAVVRTGNIQDIEKMINSARRAYELEPTSIYYISRYGTLLINFEVDIAKGIEIIDQGITASPLEPASYLLSAVSRINVAEKYLLAGQHREAEKYFREVIELEEVMNENVGDSSRLDYLLGLSHHMLGNRAQAITYFRQVKENDQFYNEAQNMLDNVSTKPANGELEDTLDLEEVIEVDEVD